MYFVHVAHVVLKSQLIKQKMEISSTPLSLTLEYMEHFFPHLFFGVNPTMDISITLHPLFTIDDVIFKMEGSGQTVLRHKGFYSIV